MGHGQRDQFSESALSGILTKLELNPAETIQRFSLRDSYAFVDLPEDKAEAILGKLEGAEVSPGVGLFFRKATIISAPREQGAAGDEGQFAEGEGSQQEFRDDGGQGENQESGEQFGQAEGDVGSESADFANDAK